MEIDYFDTIANLVSAIDYILALKGKGNYDSFNDIEPLSEYELNTIGIGNILSELQININQALDEVVNNLLIAHGILNYNDENCDYEDIQYWYELIIEKGSKGLNEFLNKSNMSLDEFAKLK